VSPPSGEGIGSSQKRLHGVEKGTVSPEDTIYLGEEHGKNFNIISPSIATYNSRNAAISLVYQMKFDEGNYFTGPGV